MSSFLEDRGVPDASLEKSSTRARRLLEREISFITSPVFDQWRKALPAEIENRDWERLESTVWLSAEEEALWFRWMNYKRYRANQWRGRLSEEPTSEVMDRIECLVQDAEEIRNGLVNVYLKLGASIAAKFANSRFSMDELMSEANTVLLACVERFDADRGFRFSTYATHSVRRHLCRYVKRASLRPLLSPPDVLEARAEPFARTLARQRNLSEAAGVLEGFLDELREREEFIVRARFGLGDSPKPQTLRAIAELLGVSRERVRQIEQRALGKLVRMAKASPFEIMD